MNDLAKYAGSDLCPSCKFDLVLEGFDHCANCEGDVFLIEQERVRQAEEARLEQQRAELWDELLAPLRPLGGKK